MELPFLHSNRATLKKKAAGEALCRHFHVSSLDGMGVEEYSIGMIAAGAVMMYLIETQKCALEHISHLQPYHVGKYMLFRQKYQTESRTGGDTA